MTRDNGYMMEKSFQYQRLSFLGTQSTAVLKCIHEHAIIFTMEVEFTLLTDITVRALEGLSLFKFGIVLPFVYTVRDDS